MEMLLKLMREKQNQNSKKFSKKSGWKKSKKCAVKKFGRYRLPLLEKNKKYPIITGEVSLTPKVPIGPNSVEIKKIILYE
ncbi:hypothetical protein [Bacillus thuringiensis]|uniref:hypothetical protein n=1 Tax=Bacillus thuringiensis TaxID=1428 RepID=UPI000BF57D58|nr:hypothetical protein [Bacillus thuringiensis]PFD55834.1 hypothetical protein CN274_24840 [Bacillus thuringiensis]